jgi:hypothetical protein
VQIPAAAEDEVHDAEEDWGGGGGDFDFGGMDPNEGSEVETRKPCPMCGEMIVRDAAKCRYCGEIFDPELKKREKKKAKSSKFSGSDDEDLTTGDWVVAVLCSGIGCIVGIVWMIQGKPKGAKMLGVSLLMQVVWTVIRIAIEAASGNLDK